MKYFDLNKVDVKHLGPTFTSLYQKLGIKNEIEFQKHLSNFNLTPGDVKKKLKIEILWNSFIYEKFIEQVEIDMEEIKKKISTNKIQKNYLISEILLDISDSKNINEKYNQHSSTPNLYRCIFSNTTH